MLRLPNVTLVCYEGRAHRLAALALADMMAQVAFAEIVIYSDVDLGVTGARWVKTASVPRDQFLNEADQIALGLKTSHFLMVQWDSGIIDPACWTDEFLQYDYIGAVWPWHREGENVGCSGFALYSTKLREYVNTHRADYPNFVNDDLFCRQYRPRLEGAGFKWAPTQVAERFAFERGPQGTTFGYHGMYNMPKFLTRGAFNARSGLDDGYMQRKPEWAETVTAAAAAYGGLT